MKFARVLLLLAVGSGLSAQTATWDTSGNGMLNGKYYFRQAVYQLSSAGTGSLYDAVSIYGTITFSGTGTYTMSATVADARAGQLQSGTATGTYAISAGGEGWISSALFSGDLIYGMVNAQGIFVGNSTENGNGYNDLFVAAPLAATLPTASTFKGSYTLSYMDLSGGTPAYTFGAMLQLNPDGAGNLGTVGVTGYFGGNGGSKTVQSLANVKYIFSGGAAVVTFPASTTAVFTGQYYLYFSPDGNFVFGGSPTSYDFFVGVRTGTGTPSLGGLYYEAGLDQDESTLSGGYAATDNYWGSFSANAGTVVGHQRLLNLLLNGEPMDYTYSDSYTLSAAGTYSSPFMNYVVSNGVRIGSGIGPYLGLTVGLQAPAMAPAAGGTGVFLNPTGVVNAGSSAPFTAGVAPGELLTLYGTGLAAGVQVAAAVPLPTTLGKVQVLINGIPAALYYVTPTQISAIVPYGITGSVAKVQVFNDNVASNAVTAFVAKTAPGVLTQLQNGLGYGDAVHADGSLVTAKNPARIGETVSLFLTGLGAVSPTIADGGAGPIGPYALATNAISVFVGGVQASVGYAGLAPQLAGLYQINLTIPATGVTAGDNALDIAGPDSYAAVCLIPVGSASGEAAPQGYAQGYAQGYSQGYSQRRSAGKPVGRPTVPNGR